MPTQNPRARGPRTFSSERKETRDNEGQLRRTIMRTKQPENTDFQSGMTRLQWTGTRVFQLNGASTSRISPNGNATIDTEYLADSSFAPPITSDDSGGDGWTFGRDGWYVVRTRLLGWFASTAAAPDAIEGLLEHTNVFFNPVPAWPVYLPVQGGGTQPVFNCEFVSRRMWMPAGEHMTFTWYWRGPHVATVGGHGIVAEIVQVG